MLRFERPPSPEGAGRAEAAPCDLERLEGVGPGLVWALRRAGIRDLAGMAALEPAGLAARLGPIGRLVPAEAWIASARARNRRLTAAGKLSFTKGAACRIRSG